jgi:hypothetical protein
MSIPVIQEVSRHDLKCHTLKEEKLVEEEIDG